MQSDLGVSAASLYLLCTLVLLYLVIHKVRSTWFPDLALARILLSASLAI